jgi:hypothetical protein
MSSVDCTVTNFSGPYCHEFFGPFLALIYFGVQFAFLGICSSVAPQAWRIALPSGIQLKNLQFVLDWGDTVFEPALLR